MTEQRLADLFTSIHAFSQALVGQAGDMTQDAESIREAARKYGLPKDILEIADRLDRRALELAHGLEVLRRLADQAMDDTQTMALDDVAAAEDT